MAPLEAFQINVGFVDKQFAPSGGDANNGAARIVVNRQITDSPLVPPAFEAYTRQ